jgi:hypothetical protein
VIKLAIYVYGAEPELSPLYPESVMKKGMLIHAYRLVYPCSPHAPAMLWVWDKVSIARLLWNATTFGRELAHQYFPPWHALAEANQRIWETYYRPRPWYELWETWQAWMVEYRTLVATAQEVYEAQYGRRSKESGP